MRRGLRVFLLAAIVATSALAVYLYADANDGALPFLNSKCVIGLQGAAVSVEVDGASANARCESMAGQTTNGGSWYVYSAGTEPGGAVICQYALNGNTWTVRDQGVANMYGTGVCQNLQEMAAGIPEEPVSTVEPEFTSVPSFEGCTVDETNDCAVDDDTIAYDESCTLGLANHDVRVQISGNTGICSAITDQIARVGSFEQVSESIPTQDGLICSGILINGELEVWDSGGARYGSDVCRQYGFYLR